MSNYVECRSIQCALRGIHRCDARQCLALCLRLAPDSARYYGSQIHISAPAMALARRINRSGSMRSRYGNATLACTAPGTIRVDGACNRTARRTHQWCICTSCMSNDTADTLRCSKHSRHNASCLDCRSSARNCARVESGLPKHTTTVDISHAMHDT